MEGVCSVRRGPKSTQEERSGQLPSLSCIRMVCRAPAMEKGDCEYLPHLTQSLLSSALPSVWVTSRNDCKLFGHSLVGIRLKELPQLEGHFQQVEQSLYLPCSLGTLMAAELEALLLF